MTVRLCHIGDMLPKLIIAVAWFPLALILLINNLVFLTGISRSIPSEKTVTENDAIRVSAAAPLDISSGQVLAANIIAGDGRAILLREFMKNSPLEPYAETIVREADHYGMDYRLVPAIAMCESNLGVRIPSSDSYNAWGIAVYTGQTEGAMFSDWTAAIAWVSRFIFDRFLVRGLIDIRDIGATWAPPSVENGHSWANCVESFMRAIQ